MILNPPLPRGVRPPQPAPAAAPTSIETVLLVHGSFANAVKPVVDGVSSTPGDPDPVPDWWQPGSSYCQRIDTLLQEAGSTARCWAHLAGRHGPRSAPVRTPPLYAWTGANTEADRRVAGRALAQQIDALEDDPLVARYHLVAHSHGGNVVVHALRERASAPRKLGAVVYMGTPYLSFHHCEPLDIRWVSLPMYAAALAASAWFWHATTENVLFWGLATVSAAIALLAELLLTTSRARAAATMSLYGSGSARAFAFSEDEAINGLLTAQEVVRHPLRFVRQFVDAAPPADPRVTPTPAPQGDIFERLRDSGVFPLLDVLEHEPASTPYPVGLLHNGRFKPRPQPRPPVIDRLQKAYDSPWVSVALSAIPLRGHLQFALWVLLLAPRLLVFAVWAAGAGLSGLLRLMWRWLLYVLAIVLVAGGLPTLVRKGVFGANEGRFVEVAKLPPGVFESVAISDPLAAELAAVKTRLGALAGVSVLDAVKTGNAFSIKSSVQRALTDANMVHSHYYKSNAVIQATAGWIADPSPPPSPSTFPLLAAMNANNGALVAAAFRKIK